MHARRNLWRSFVEAFTAFVHPELRAELLALVKGEPIKRLGRERNIAEASTRWRRDHPEARAGVSRIRFHDLRHTPATLLFGKGIHPKIVSEMLGHSSMAIALDIYSHVIPTMQKQAATAMDALFGS